MTGETELDGWKVWRRWGSWVLVVDPDLEAVVLTFAPLDYWIPLERVHENDWADHLRHKDWISGRENNAGEISRHYADRNWLDFGDGIAFARSLIVRRRTG